MMQRGWRPRTDICSTQNELSATLLNGNGEVELGNGKYRPKMEQE